MRTRSVVTTASVALALSAALPMSAQAKDRELVDRSLFDGTPERTAASLHLGSEHRKAKLVGDGLIAVAHHAFGGQASFSGAFRW